MGVEVKHRGRQRKKTGGGKKRGREEGGWELYEISQRELQGELGGTLH